MKICFFNSGYLPDRGGVATLAGGLAESLASSPAVGVVKVVAFKNSQPRHEIRGKLEVFAYPYKKMWQMIFVVFWYTLKFRQFDVFHATNIFPVGFFTLLFGKYIFGKKVFITIHGTDVLAKSGSGLVKWAKGFTMRRSDRILPNSRSTMKLAAEDYQIDDQIFFVIYPGVTQLSEQKPSVDIRRRYGLTDQDFVVLTVGQLIKRKGTDDLIRAIKGLDDETIKLLVVGEGPEKQNLQNLVRELGLASRVVFAGSVEGVEDFYETAQVFALPAKYLAEQGDIEGLGIAFLEAQYFGKPVIGTDSGGIPETFRANETGFLVGEGDIAAIAERIKHLRHNPQIYERMSNAAKTFVRQEFPWTKSVRQHLNIYSQTRQAD
ncbi:MAG: hypothetical protein A3K06_00980 [Candidatus Doudnabacteria bacterium RIFCSPHIGHO2_01_52_17]|uniref:Glycosyl transferase family 1 domain-containing protein n=1 Tax=Candidatus Doudnabacteria bacterium RIFCSPHIGHO2_01_52_17 TaxID=1817820 RepID=A0A1F5NEZ5_9BACT|nr:MAG: Phosphatidylinositol alpha-1,6-mannosyltransferase [Parcubacteria group bacterium GW2011_GWA2_52_8]OGE76134.1 MAG: hypothetical protein A3K06_00980 [Candidatus Doudnabacteria bacterium RIFCSPHIGHO2_01_52_17]